MIFLGYVGYCHATLTLDLEPVNPPFIELPSFGSELSNYLENVNQYETNIAKTYLKELLANPLRSKIMSWFKLPPPELDRTLLRKISNCTLSAGDAGIERTTDALRNLKFENVPLSLEITPKEAALELRSMFSDYRSARNWLDNQFKCVNSILSASKIIGNKGSQQLQQSKINNEKDFEKWLGDLVDVWSASTKVNERLRSSYLNNWQLFKVGFDSSLMNGTYQITLKRQIDVYLIPEIERDKFFSDLYQESFYEPKQMNSKYEMQIEISGGEVIFYAILNNKFRDRSKLNQIKTDLAFKLSNQPKSSVPKIAISELNSELPTLCLRMQMPGNKSKYEKISELINNFFEDIK